ncbi:hypothetical protein [Chitinophaga ginsengisoli]|uniref:Uncharacterized protein n=1 Tax=Chitinophaga ginsengisoli TaxID=363837 RepID=A0A2P8GLI4_9BACT|nr:hypothetical protein [Chitinophaga ginsengisoli]PSL34824.1 hypothetical protein CLV42_102397 [Chitinophaga ginsengisoli]
MEKAFTRIKSSEEKRDIQDNPQDERKMQREETEIQLPDVSDIPGQEHIHVPPLGELADTTISSDDEEGKGLLDDEEDIDDESDVTDEERQDLEDSANITPGEEDADSLRRASLDSTDDDGDPLNEGSFGEETSAADLDIPGAELDDENEDIGAEDEENNNYSRGSDSNDNMTEGTP